MYEYVLYIQGHIWQCNLVRNHLAFKECDYGPDARTFWVFFILQLLFRFNKSDLTNSLNSLTIIISKIHTPKISYKEGHEHMTPPLPAQQKTKHLSKVKQTLIECG